MMSDRERIELLQRHGQMQVLRYFGELTPEQQHSLLLQVDHIDFHMIEEAMKGPEPENPADIAPYPTETVQKWQSGRPVFEAEGLSLLRQKKAAAVVLAGGQGSRLGFNGPKGTLNVGLTKPLYLFEILLRNLTRNLEKAGGANLFVPFLVMTSPQNDADTRAFFEEHEYFGYPKEDVFFFVQDLAPSLDHNGKILLEAKDRISLSPNGNGGWFKPLSRCGLLADLKAQGVEWLNVFSVDNVLQNILDPVFLGACSLGSYPAGGKVIAKVDPDEKVGTICCRKGRPAVVEYSELTDNMRQARDSQGRYLYHYGVTLNYLFHIPETEQASGQRLRIHLANKRIACLNDQGVLEEPAEPNGYKLEYFIFDIFEAFDKVLSFECVREEEFAPIKNRTGVDSLESARKLYQQYTGITL